MAGEHQNDDFILYCPDEEVKEKHHVQDVQGPFVHGSIWPYEISGIDNENNDCYEHHLSLTTINHCQAKLHIMCEYCNHESVFA